MRLVILILLISSISSAQLRVAVIDSGTDMELVDAPFCEIPLPDASNIKHGTSIVDLIAKNAGDADYCIYSFRIAEPRFNLKKYLNTLKYLTKIHVDVLNLSIEGTIYSKTEAILIKQLLNQGVTIIAAAGNDGIKLTKHNCKIYPACIDPRIVVVGSYNKFSNTGDRIDIKTNRDHGCVGGICLTGTSQATAVETGRFIEFLDKHE